MSENQNNINGNGTIKKGDVDEIKIDRLAKYLTKKISKFVFVNFSEEFMGKLGIGDIMNNVPVPLEPSDLAVFAGGNGVSAVKIAENMAWVIGADMQFKYAPKYVEYMKKFFNENICSDILEVGVKAIEEGDMYKSCIHFRAALMFEPDLKEARYNYMRICKQIYIDSDNSEEIGNFKAESFEILEQLTIDFDDYDMPFYFLGYMYLNMGLYIKAQLTWKRFLEITDLQREKEEISLRLTQLAEPVRVEQGCNDIMSGKFEEGISVLESYIGGQFDAWWPLHFYLGVAYQELGENEKALERYKRTLQLNASHLVTMEAIIKIYEELGDEENAQKYFKKIEVMKKNASELLN